MKKISTTVDRIVARILGKKAIQEYEAFQEWNTVVGDVVAQVSVPTKVIKGVLYVRVKNSTWRQELSMQKPQILEKFKARFGPDIITDIHFQ